MVTSISQDLGCVLHRRAESMGPVAFLKSSRELPQELVDLIVDHLQGDHRALIASSLISRTWASSSRRHLFNCIEISASKAPAVHACLDNPGCTFRSSIRAVVVKSEGPVALQYWLQRLLPLLSNMRLIQKMEVADTQDMTIWRALQSSTTAAQITHLTLRDVRFKSFTSWKQTIQSFPSLTSIRHITSSDRDTLEWQSGNDESTYLVPPNLRHLEIVAKMRCPVQQIWSQLMWDWLLRSGTRLTRIRVEGLITVSLNDVPSESLKTFTEYIRFLGPSLESFNMPFKDKHSATRFYGQMDFMSNTGFRELEIGNICLYHGDDGFTLSYFFLGLSRTWVRFPRNPHLKKITVFLEITLFDADSLDFFNYADPELTEEAFLALDVAFSGPLFPNLKEVAFMCKMADDQVPWPKYRKSLSTEVGEFLGQNLPNTKKKGILGTY